MSKRQSHIKTLKRNFFFFCRPRFLRGKRWNDRSWKQTVFDGEKKIVYFLSNNFRGRTRPPWRAMAALRGPFKEAPSRPAFAKFDRGKRRFDDVAAFKYSNGRRERVRPWPCGVGYLRVNISRTRVINYWFRRRVDRRDESFYARDSYGRNETRAMPTGDGGVSAPKTDASRSRIRSEWKIEKNLTPRPHSLFRVRHSSTDATSLEAKSSNARFVLNAETLIRHYRGRVHLKST